MPFKGAMSRRSVSVYLKHTIPEQFIDTTLPIRMRKPGLSTSTGPSWNTWT